MSTINLRDELIADGLIPGTTGYVEMFSVNGSDIKAKADEVYYLNLTSEDGDGICFRVFEVLDTEEKAAGLMFNVIEKYERGGILTKEDVIAYLSSHPDLFIPAYSEFGWNSDSKTFEFWTAFERALYGYVPDEMIGDSLSELIIKFCSTPVLRLTDPEISQAERVKNLDKVLKQLTDIVTGAEAVSDTSMELIFSIEEG